MKRIAAALFLLVLVFSGAFCSGCAEKEQFSFIIRWGAAGDSFYNSSTGLLVKSYRASDPEHFRTVLKPGGEVLSELASLAETVDFDAIPDLPGTYDPFSPPGIEHSA